MAASIDDELEVAKTYAEFFLNDMSDFSEEEFEEYDMQNFDPDFEDLSNLNLAPRNWATNIA